MEPTTVPAKGGQPQPQPQQHPRDEAAGVKRANKDHDDPFMQAVAGASSRNMRVTQPPRSDAAAVPAPATAEVKAERHWLGGVTTQNSTQPKRAEQRPQKRQQQQQAEVKAEQATAARTNTMVEQLPVKANSRVMMMDVAGRVAKTEETSAASSSVVEAQPEEDADGFQLIDDSDEDDDSEGDEDYDADHKTAEHSAPAIATGRSATTASRLYGTSPSVTAASVSGQLASTSTFLLLRKVKRIKEEDDQGELAARGIVVAAMESPLLDDGSSAQSTTMKKERKATAKKTTADKVKSLWGSDFEERPQFTDEEIINYIIDNQERKKGTHTTHARTRMRSRTHALLLSVGSGGDCVAGGQLSRGQEAARANLRRGRETHVAQATCRLLLRDRFASRLCHSVSVVIAYALDIGAGVASQSSRARIRAQGQEAAGRRDQRAADDRQAPAGPRCRDASSDVGLRTERADDV
jgi:hypothetical protein